MFSFNDFFVISVLTPQIIISYFMFSVIFPLSCYLFFFFLMTTYVMLQYAGDKKDKIDVGDIGASKIISMYFDGYSPDVIANMMNSDKFTVHDRSYTVSMVNDVIGRYLDVYLKDRMGKLYESK